MQAVPGVYEMFFMLVAWSGIGIPLGVPPQPEDALLARIAPEKCLYYASWSGMAAPDASSDNKTEQLLADPEVQALITEVLTKIRHYADQEDTDLDLPEGVSGGDVVMLVETLLTQPTAIYVSDFAIQDDRADIRAALISRTGDKTKRVEAVLRQLHSSLAGDEPAVEKVGDGQFYVVPTPPNAPKVRWGVRGKYLIVGVGEGAVEDLFANVKTPAPPWYERIKQQLPVDRRLTVGHVNLQGIIELAREYGGVEVSKPLEELGVANLVRLDSVSGLDGKGFVTKGRLTWEGEPAGIFQLADAKPLTAQNLKHIPEDAILAGTLRLDAAKLLEMVMQLSGNIEPDMAEEMNQGLDELQQNLGMDLKRDLLAHVGDVWTIYTAPDSGGLITGWLATVEVRDQDRLLKTHDQLVRMMQRAMDEDEFQVLKRSRFNGQEIHYLNVPDEEFFVTPSWCITETHLVVAAFPQAIKAFLARANDSRSLADVPAVAQALQQENGPMTLWFQDNRVLFEAIYPWLQIGLKFVLNETDIDFDVAMLPSPGAISRHLQPQIGMVRRTEDGMEFASQQTIPGNNVAAVAPVGAALLLPAIWSARRAARDMQSINNLKQLGLAFHNFHDTHRGIPPRYSVDKDEKPLLSWRVHLLPYLEQQPLYERFHLDEPWDSPHNKKLIPLMPQSFVSPGADAEPGKTRYLAIDSTDSIWQAPREKFRPSATFAAVTDGTSNTAMLVEADEAVIWTEPDDYKVDPKDPLKGLGELRRGQFLMALCDGSVRKLARFIDDESIMHIFSKSDGEVVDFGEFSDW